MLEVSVSKCIEFLPVTFILICTNKESNSLILFWRIRDQYTVSVNLFNDRNLIKCLYKISWQNHSSLQNKILWFNTRSLHLWQNEGLKKTPIFVHAYSCTALWPFRYSDSSPSSCVLLYYYFFLPLYLLFWFDTWLLHLWQIKD